MGVAFRRESCFAKRLLNKDYVSLLAMAQGFDIGKTMGVTMRSYS